MGGSLDAHIVHERIQRDAAQLRELCKRFDTRHLRCFDPTRQTQ